MPRAEIGIRNTKRLMKDLADFANAAAGMRLLGYEDDMSSIHVCISGPKDSAYEGGSFTIEFKIPLNFPYSSPEIFFRTPVWHPNISKTGAVCMDLLDINWHAGITLIELAEAVQSLLCMPNVNSPMNSDAALIMQENEEMSDATVLIWTRVHAGGTKRAPDQYEEKLNVLTALGVSVTQALSRCTNHKWNLQEACDGL